MKHIIKYRKVKSLMDEYISERNKILDNDESSYKHINEYENNIYIGNYCFIDIRHEKKWKYNKIAAMEITKADLLFNYEDILDKKKTYIIIDENGTKGAFICHVLEYFGYDCVYLVEGFNGYLSWWKDKYLKKS